MNTPFFSVIIPTYNRADLIVKSIESVLKQTFTDFEIIVVDNKSTDHTVEVLQPYVAANRIRLFVQEKNYERARSRNKGFEEAKGKMVTLLDSDDLIYPDCLADAHLYKLKYPEVNFFHCGNELINDKGEIVKKGDLTPKKNPFKELANGNYISNIGIFIDAAIAKETGVDEAPVLIGMEDYDFLLRLLKRTGRVDFIPKINCGILQHHQRTSLIQDMPVIEKRVNYFVHKTLKENLFTGNFAPYKKNFLSGNHLYICGAAAVRGFSRLAFKYWFKAAASNISSIFTIKHWKHFFVIFKYMVK